MKNIFFISLGYSSKIFFGLYVFISAGRLLSSEDFAIFTQHLTFFAIISILSIFGAGNFLVKEFARRDFWEFFPKAFLLNVTSVVFFIFSILIIYEFINENLFFLPHGFYFYFYFCVVYAVGGFNIVLISYLISRSYYKKNALLNVVSLLLSIPLTYLWIAYRGIDSYFYAFSFFTVVFFIVSVVYFSIFSNFKIFSILNSKNKFFDLSLLREALGFSLPVWIGVLFLPVAGVYLRNEYVKEFGLVNLSLWQAAVKFSDLLQQMFGILISQLIFPFLVKWDGDKSKIIMNFSLKIGVAFLLIIVLSEFFASYIFVYILGSGYRESGEFLSFYIAGELFRALCLIMVYGELAKSKYGASIFFEILQGVILFFVSICIMKWSKFSISYAYFFCYVLCYLLINLKLRLPSWR